jgi:hypothetical protein
MKMNRDMQPPFARHDSISLIDIVYANNEKKGVRIVGSRQLENY